MNEVQNMDASADLSIADLYCLTTVHQVSHAIMIIDEYRCVIIGIVYCLKKVKQR